MKKLVLLGALLALGSIALQDVSSGHGGTYRGPGDTVPPGGGGGGGGGTGPSTPGPSGPSTGGPSGPSTPSGPSSGPATGGGGAKPAGPSTGGGSSGPDLTTWDFWWGFNKDQYLNLKAAIYDGGVVSGSDTFFLGQGQANQGKTALKPSEESIRTKIVPALKEALEKERSNDIVTGCLIALGKIGDVKNGEDGSSEFEPIIKKFLTDSNQEIAETAAVALGILANDASVGTLKELALDSSDGRKLIQTGSTEVPYRTRAFAIYGLGLIGNRTPKNEIRQEVAHVLMSVLEKPDTSTRDVKVAALISLGLVPIDVDQSESPDVKTDHAASRQTQIKYIKKLFLDPQQHYMLRAHAPAALARLLVGAPPALREDIARVFDDQIAQFSKETKDEVKQSCVLALGMVADSSSGKVNADIRKSLMRFTKEGDQQSKNFTMIALAQIGGRGKGEDFEKGRSEVRNFILSSLTEGKSHLKPWAGIAVGVMERELLNDGQIPSDGAKSTLRDQFKKEGQPDRVGAYAIGLGIAKDVESKKDVQTKMKDTSEVSAKGYMCVALGLMDAREAIKDLQEVVKDSTYKPELLKDAAVGLGLLGDKDLVPYLCQQLELAKSQASQAALASALGFIGDSRSIDPLVAMLKRKEGITDTARGFAAVALGIVADKEMFPWNSKISTNINYRANTTTLTGENGTGILDIL
jgi:HEAT repeat protein